MANPLLPKPSLSATGSYFLGLGFRAFGGLNDVPALLTRELVERRAWPRETDLTEALPYTKLLPGSTVVQVVTYLGWKLRGWPLARPRLWWRCYWPPSRCCTPTSWLSTAPAPWRKP